ncbi:MAG: hypothetical protein HQ483_13915 [Rhodospirillales bacterium]|nr:hypothetical protein [Rhodospirillales bacterium]
MGVNYLFGLFFSCILYGGFANAAENKTYIVGYSENAPFHDLARDRLRLAYLRAGLNVQFVAASSIRSLHNANRGNFDGDTARIALVEKTYKNLRRVDVTLAELRGAAYTIRDDLKTYDATVLKTSIIGRVRGVLWAEHLTAGHRSDLTNNHAQLFDMLQRKRFDVAFATEISGDILIRQADGRYANIVKLMPPAYTARTYHYLHKQNASIIPKLEAALRSLDADPIR